MLTFKRDQVKNLRLGLGLSTEELAAKLGVTRQAIWSWENGQPPSIENLLKLVNVTGAKLEGFFEDVA